MSVNGVTNVLPNDTIRTQKDTAKQHTDTEKSDKTTNSTAVIYEKTAKSLDEKSNYQKDTNQVDQQTINRLLKEAQIREERLRDLVEKMLLKQGQKITDTTNIYSLLREGKIQVDPETQAQAQKDISEDGYWGVKQTSDRLVSFAKALSGGDSSKADEMMAAIKKGYEMATKAWGDELPEICQNTLDTAMSKLEAWRDGSEEENK